MHFSTIATLFISASLPLMAVAQAPSAVPTAPAKHHRVPHPFFAAQATGPGTSATFNLTGGLNYTLVLNSTDAVKGKGVADPGKLAVELVGVDSATQGFESGSFFKFGNRITNVTVTGNYAIKVDKATAGVPLIEMMFIEHKHKHHKHRNGTEHPAAPPA